MAGIQDLHCGFQKTGARYILSHDIYQCPVDAFMLSNNRERLKELWYPNWPFAKLIDCAFEFREFLSDAKRPINENRVMT